jgi:hypothetical protein
VVHQLTACPWCGSGLEPGRDITVDLIIRQTLVRCPDPFCPFSTADGLPVVVVDEEIYRLLPALVIGTVDKFAQLTWRGETQALFGKVRRRCTRHGYVTNDVLSAQWELSTDTSQHPAKNGHPVDRMEHVADPCGIETRTLGLGATNGRFAMRLRAFSLPQADDEVDQRVAENWAQLGMLAILPEAQAKGLMKSFACWPDVEPYGVDAVWQAIQRHAEDDPSAGDADDDLDLAGPEWDAFTRPSQIDLPDFTTRKEPPPAASRRWLHEVVLVPRLREVSALYGFTRIDAPEWDMVTTDEERTVRLARDAPTWVPCAQTRGEGIFLRFGEAQVAEWEQRPDVQARRRVLEAAHEKWRADRRLPPGQWPGMRYILLHTFAHAAIRELALECGYSAAGIAERIYAQGGERPGRVSCCTQRPRTARERSAAWCHWAAATGSARSLSRLSTPPGYAVQTRCAPSTTRATAVFCTEPPATPACSRRRRHANAVTTTSTGRCLSIPSLAAAQHFCLNDQHRRDPDRTH